MCAACAFYPGPPLWTGGIIRVSHFVNNAGARTGPHSPEMYRANGPIRNIPEFYTVFGVKEGDKLFLPPDRQVKIW